MQKYQECQSQSSVYNMCCTEHNWLDQLNNASSGPVLIMTYIEIIIIY